MRPSRQYPAFTYHAYGVMVPGTTLDLYPWSSPDLEHRDDEVRLYTQPTRCSVPLADPSGKH